MKKIIMALTLTAFGLISGVEARCVNKDPDFCSRRRSAVSVKSHEHHPKHNMIMFGETEVFLSHIVYKVPHNYQVLLNVQLPILAFQAYLEAKKNAPKNLMIFLLDSMDISQINSASLLKGTMYSEDLEGVRSEVLADIEIPKEGFKILFFNELPTNLGGLDF